MFPIEGYQEPSIQSEIVAARRKLGKSKIDEEFELAKKSARGVLFDCLADAVVGREARTGKVDV